MAESDDLRERVARWMADNADELRDDLDSGGFVLSYQDLLPAASSLLAALGLEQQSDIQMAAICAEAEGLVWDRLPPGNQHHRIRWARTMPSLYRLADTRTEAGER